MKGSVNRLEIAAQIVKSLPGGNAKNIVTYLEMRKSGDDASVAAGESEKSFSTTFCLLLLPLLNRECDW